MVLPADTENFAKAVQVELVQFLDMQSVASPSLAALQELCYGNVIFLCYPSCYECLSNKVVPCRRNCELVYRNLIFHKQGVDIMVSLYKCSLSVIFHNETLMVEHGSNSVGS